MFLIAGFAVAASMPAQPLTWNMNSLKEARSLTAAAAKLVVRDADKALAKDILTVMDKDLLPPGVDKHDYVSMGRYWWPNPDTESGLPYIRKDGVSNPEIEKLDRYPLAQMTRSVKVLAVAYYLTGNGDYAAKAVDNMRKWFLDPKTKMNPHLNYGQMVPGRNNGMGRGEGIIDTYSFIEMLDGVELLRSSSEFSRKTEKGLTDWFSAYLDWMLTSEIGNEENTAKNNHGLAFDVQVVRYASFAGRTDVARKTLEDFPGKRLFLQIEPDGSQPLELARTTAFGYSVFNLEHMLDMCAMAKKFDIDLLNLSSSDGRSIRHALDFLIPYLGTTVQDFPYKQIKDWNKVQDDLRWLLRRADKLSDGNDYQRYYEKLMSPDLKNIDLIIY